MLPSAAKGGLPGGPLGHQESDFEHVSLKSLLDNSKWRQPVGEEGPRAGTGHLGV